ncbi:MAG: cytochrome c3 family protein [Spirochaetota bacterium]|nr:cytochrome c3 family protein [Spirochaetota bacterium]
MHFISKIIISLLFIIIYYLAEAYDIETVKIMPFVSSRSYCTKCHKQTNLKKDKENRLLTCDNLCLTCHKDRNRHHRVGLIIKDIIPKEFYLTKNNKIACYTCHNLNIKRFDSLSWRAESLFESIFRIKSKYKTFYLSMRNNNGQLCKKCH